MAEGMSDELESQQRTFKRIEEEFFPEQGPGNSVTGSAAAELLRDYVPMRRKPHPDDEVADLARLIDRTRREAIDAFIRDELPVLLTVAFVKALPDATPDDIAAKVAELRSERETGK